MKRQTLSVESPVVNGHCAGDIDLAGGTVIAIVQTGSQ